MKVEFIVNTDINDGRQIFIQESEFKKQRIMKKNTIVLHLQQIVYLHSMVILMTLLLQLSTKRYYLL